MRLKKLEIFGFKSFADKTEIIFDHGVTCIVGPNGCGKSNISDSIRWVLGERSAKLLRGSKMEDVIFNGTDFRKPLAMAEVSLTIDNSNRGLPIDFQEVTLTRRLYRSGESEYLINKTVCRLKDIQDLILDTGIGSNSYSMIEQGRIDYILNAGPDERRFLIEEAAGISKFKVKKEEAIRKLERTEENLLRLKDIVHEVERNIQYAERQARRAERYKEQLEKLKDLEIRKAFYELSALGSQKKEQEEKLIGLKQKIQELDQSLADVQSQYHDLNNQMHNISNRQATEDARRYEIRSQIEQNKQLLRFNQEKRRSLDVRQGEIAQEKSALEEQLQKNFQEMAEKEQELAGLEQEKRALHGFLNSAEEKLRKIESELAAKRSELEQTKSEAFSAAASTSSLRNEFHRISAFLETTAEHQKKQEAGAVRFQQEIENWAVKEKTYAEEVAAFGEKSLKLQQEKSNCENQIKQANESLESLRLESTKWDRLLHEKEARLKMLAEIDRASGTNIDHLLSQSPTLQKDLVRSLRDLFTVESGYELALEACLGTYVHSLVVDDITTAQNLFSLLHDQSPSPVGVLIREKGSELQNAVPPIHPKIKKSLNDVVRIKPEFNSVVASFLNHVFLLDPINAADLAELLPMADKDIFVSPDGWVLGPHQRIFYRPGSNSAETNTFKRGAEIKSLQTELEEAKKGKLEFESRIESLRQNLNQFQGRLPKLEEELMDSAIQKESFESLRSGIKERLISYQRELELITIENQDTGQQRQNAVLEREKLEKELARAEECEKSIRQNQEMLIHDIEKMDHQNDAFLQQLAEHKMRIESMKERGILLQDTIGLLAGHQERSQNRLEVLTLEMQKNQETQQGLASSDEQIAGEQTQLEDSLRRAEVALELIRQEKAGVENRMNEIQGLIQDSSRKKQTLTESTHGLEMSTLDLGYKEKNIYERLEQTYRIDLRQMPAENYSLRENETVDTINEQVSGLREKVEGLGTVNLLAIEEYDELKQRYDFLSTQQKDLQDSRESLLEAIRKINRTTKSLFEETFVKVQETFKEYYQILFRGGEARLVLVDETNPLESGIDIVVRPPGKKLQHITLLSGGEKALTAIALLFSLFKIKPSPYCVLDEVDAPLDEANIDRFLSVLRTFLDMSQFIIVTHNRKTIAMGDSLFGVTMQEAGVSRLVSVKMNPNAPLPEYLQNKTGEKQTSVSDTIIV